MHALCQLPFGASVGAGRSRGAQSGHGGQYLRGREGTPRVYLLADARSWSVFIPEIANIVEAFHGGVDGPHRLGQ